MKTKEQKRQNSRKSAIELNELTKVCPKEQRRLLKQLIKLGLI